MKTAEFTHYQFMATLDRRTCSRCGERDGEVYKLSEMNQGENAPPMHARCRCTIVAYDDGGNGQRATRDSDGKYQRIPADMSYRDWKAVYVDKSKTFETWQAEFAVKRAADENSPLRQRGRAIIEDLAAGRDPRAAKSTVPDESLQRRTTNQGVFAHLEMPMQKRAVEQICRRYGVDITGLRIKNRCS